MKRYLSILLPLILFSGCPSPTDTGPKSQTVVHFKKPALWGTEVYAYSWKTDNSPNTAAYPGNAMTFEGNDWYKITLSTQDSNFKLLFNDRAGSQTPDLTRSGEGWYSGSTWYDANPDGLTPAVTTLGSLLITEVGSGFSYCNQSNWFEVYNNSATETAQLSMYTLRTYGVNRSAGGYLTDTIFTLPEMLIPPKTFAIIRGKPYGDFNTGKLVAYVLNAPDTIPLWVTDGFIELLQNNATVDFVRFGNSTATPTTAGQWDSTFAPALSGSAFGKSICRKSPALSDNNTAADWTSANFATPGGANDVPDSTTYTDTDSDGIPDQVKASGKTFAGMNLYGWGATDNTKRDIFIHVDYMDYSSDPGIIPNEAALDKVVAAFAAKNIRVHFDVGDLFTTTVGTRYNLSGTSHKRPFSPGLTLGNYPNRANLYNYKNNYMPLERRQVFHYMLFGYLQDPTYPGGSSGLAEIYGNDLLVTLGGWNLVTASNELINVQASTIMHELGHNLNLQHGGDVPTNYKPNYYSIMNYMYQVNGLSTIGNREGDRYYLFRWIQSGYANNGFKTYYTTYGLTNANTTTTFKMDYSDGSSGSLNESSLDENAGLRRTSSTSIDFNGNGTISAGVSYDLDSTTATTHTDFNDWANLKLDFCTTWSGDTNGVSLIAPDNTRDILVNDQQEVIYETLTRQDTLGPVIH